MKEKLVVLTMPPLYTFSVREANWDKHGIDVIHEACPLENKKWLYARRLLGMSIFKEREMCHDDQ
jgi:hypothetical protein